MKAVNPKNKDIFLRGFELFEQERFEEALEAFEASARVKPDNADIRYGLGLMYLLTGNKNAAMKEYEILISLDKVLGQKLLRFIAPSRQFSLKI